MVRMPSRRGMSGIGIGLARGAVFGKKLLDEILLAGVTWWLTFGSVLGFVTGGGNGCIGVGGGGIELSALGVASRSGEFRTPNFSLARWRVLSASSGSSIFQRPATVCNIPKVLRAHSQLSPISSRCFRPWTRSRAAFLSGRFRRCTVHAE